MIISTKFLPATNTLGARWKATVMSETDRRFPTRSITEPYDHANPSGQPVRLALRVYLQSELGQPVFDNRIQTEMDALGVVFMTQETPSGEHITLITRKHTYLAPTSVVPA